MKTLIAAATATAVLTGLVCAPPAHAAPKVSSPGRYSGHAPKLYDEWVRTSQYLPMSDGTRLAVDVYRPAVNGRPVAARHPVVWEHQLSRAARNPDGTVALAGTLAGMAELTTYGYVLAYVDRRGNGASFGTMRGYHSRTEARDAYEITEWLARQPWSNGRIGVYGCSNTGEAAMHAATSGAPHLRAVFAGNYSFHKYDGFNRGGIRANWGAGPNRTLEEDLRNLPVDADTDGSLLNAAVRQHLGNTSLRDLWRAAPYRDSRVASVAARPWEEYSLATYRRQIERSGVAIYGYDGWQDDFRKEVLVGAATLRNRHKVLLGPWGHCGYQGFDMVAERHRFFDHWLKGVDNGIMDEPPIRYYTEHGDRTGVWRDARAWPPRARKTTYHLGGGRSGTVGSVNDGTLSTERPRAGRDDYTVDYSVTCPAPVGLGQTCPQDEKGLTYTTAPLPADTEVTGHPVVELRISSTATDGDFFAYLEDVAPDGTVRVITDGRLRASLRKPNRAPYDVLGTPWHRSTAADAAPLRPGERATIVFDMLPLSHVFRRGHRLRLTVTGADVRESDRRAVSPAPVVSVHRGPGPTSKITLPVVAR